MKIIDFFFFPICAPSKLNIILRNGSILNVVVQIASRKMCAHHRLIIKCRVRRTWKSNQWTTCEPYMPCFECFSPSHNFFFPSIACYYFSLYNIRWEFFFFLSCCVLWECEYVEPRHKYMYVFIFFIHHLQMFRLKFRIQLVFWCMFFDLLLSSSSSSSSWFLFHLNFFIGIFFGGGVWLSHSFSRHNNYWPIRALLLAYTLQVYVVGMTETTIGIVEIIGSVEEMNPVWPQAWLLLFRCYSGALMIIVQRKSLWKTLSKKKSCQNQTKSNSTINFSWSVRVEVEGQ